jgi:outer membrane protein
MGPVLARSLMRAAAIALGLVLFAPPAAQAMTLAEALVRAYQGNPQLNAERAKLRATDEGVPQALSGYRPQIALGLSAGLQGVRNLLPGGGDPLTASLRPWSAGLTINQTLFNGMKTANQVRQAESQVQGGRELLRGVVQNVLLDTVTTYMSVLANQALVEAQRTNVQFLREVLQTTHKRYDAGDVTPTDVAQAEARLNRGIADLNNAQVNLAVSRATFAQVVGILPDRLTPADPIDRLLPRQQDQAIAVSRREHPSITAASFDVDAAQSAVAIAQAALYPTLGVQGSISRSVDTDSTLSVGRTDQASVVGNLNVPVYDGGMAASQVRQSKETLAQTRIVLDRVRAQAETAAVAAWATNEGSRVALQAATSEVKAAEIALSGVQKEAQAGQRTTLDVLNAQQDLIAARSRLIVSQRDRVVASYTLLSAIGRLDHLRLRLNTPDYDAQTHYSQVRDAWHGVRTPSGQ